VRSLAVAVALVVAGCGTPSGTDMSAAHDMAMSFFPVDMPGGDMTCNDSCPSGQFYFSGAALSLTDASVPVDGCNRLPLGCSACSCLQPNFQGYCYCHVCLDGTLSLYCLYPGPA
jgi:hypothetical protein